MPERVVTIRNALGLHARAASRFVDVACGFRSRIQIRVNGAVVDGKSILGLLTLAAAQGTELILVAEGPDAEPALDELEALIGQRFGEER